MTGNTASTSRVFKVGQLIDWDNKHRKGNASYRDFLKEFGPSPYQIVEILGTDDTSIPGAGHVKYVRIRNLKGETRSFAPAWFKPHVE